MKHRVFDGGFKKMAVELSRLKGSVKEAARFRLKKGGSFLQFDCKMSRKSKVRITGELRKLAFHNKTQRGIQELANLLNPKIRGWIQ